MALPPSTANWHWKNKNITRWGQEWFERELTTISIQGDKEGEVISISKVTEVDGDIELGQRKSKYVNSFFFRCQITSRISSLYLPLIFYYNLSRLITIFDCKISLAWTGTTSEGTEVKGTLTIPEVSHEIVCDNLSEYVVRTPTLHAFDVR